MSADSEKPNIIGVIGWNIAPRQNLWVGVGRIERPLSLALCGRFDQFRSPYSCLHDAQSAAQTTRFWLRSEPFINGFFSFKKAQVWPSHSKSNISTTTSATTTLDTPLERSSHCASNDEKYYEKPFQTPKIHSPEWRKSPSENWNRKSNRSSSVEQLWSPFFRQSTAWILAVICFIHF